MSAIPLQRMAAVLALMHTRSAKAINIESDLIWVLHVKKSLLGEFAGEVRIDLPKLGIPREPCESMMLTATPIDPRSEALYALFAAHRARSDDARRSDPRTRSIAFHPNGRLARSARDSGCWLR